MVERCIEEIILTPAGQSQQLSYLNTWKISSVFNGIRTYELCAVTNWAMKPLRFDVLSFITIVTWLDSMPNLKAIFPLSLRQKFVFSLNNWQLNFSSFFDLLGHLLLYWRPMKCLPLKALVTDQNYGSFFRLFVFNKWMIFAVTNLNERPVFLVHSDN